jgi:DNA-binding XRE family transcriptional regulator
MKGRSELLSVNYRMINQQEGRRWHGGYSLREEARVGAAKASLVAAENERLTPSISCTMDAG